VENEVAAVEHETVAPKPYSWKKALIGVLLLPLLVWFITQGVVQLYIGLGGTIGQSLGFLLTSGSFILTALIYILITGQIRQIWTVLKLRGFHWWYIPLGLGGAVVTYLGATILATVGILLSQLGGNPPEIGSNSTSQTIGDLTQSGSLLFVGFLVAIMAPVAEEIFFRGALLGSIVQESVNRWLRVGAVVIVSVIFGLFHFQGATGTISDVLAMVTPGLVGVTAAILTLKFNSLYPAIFTHLFYNGIVLAIIASSAAAS